MRINFHTTIASDKFAEAGAAILAGAAKHIASKAEDVKTHAANTVAVDTGAAQAGFYTCTQAQDGYNEALAAAQTLRPDMPIAEHCDTPAGPMDAIISNAAGHLLFLEGGTVRMAAQPSLTPAAEVVLADLQATLDAAIAAAITAALGA